MRAGVSPDLASMKAFTARITAREASAFHRSPLKALFWIELNKWSS
jgi:hypothetical protein